MGALTPLGTVNVDMPLGIHIRPICSVKHLLNCVKCLANAVSLIDSRYVNAACVPVLMSNNVRTLTYHFLKKNSCGR